MNNGAICLLAFGAISTALASSCSSAKKSGACADGVTASGVTATFHMTATDASGSPLEVNDGCAVIDTTFAEVATFSENGGDGSLATSDVAQIFVPASPGTVVATSSGNIVFDFQTNTAPGTFVSHFAQNCFSLGLATGTSDGSVTFTQTSATAIAGTFTFPVICSNYTDYYTNVSGTFSIP